jgi:HK97 family phage prohead protease
VDTKLCELQLKRDDKLGPREALARISTTSVDRDGDVLLPSGLDARDYRRNPVVLLGHDMDRVVGQATNLRTTSDAVMATVRFAERPASLPESAEWMPDTVLSLMQQGVLRAFSVGFRVPPGGARDATAKDAERFGDDARTIITRWHLLEFSVVSIPANQDALLVAVAKGLVPDGDTVRQLGLSPNHLRPAPRVQAARRGEPFRVPAREPFRVV